MKKNRVLIIEDDQDLREGLSFSFLGDGYEVLDVGTKKEGLKEIEKNMYDIVLCGIPVSFSIL